MISYCIAKGYKIDKVICEIGSGLNDNRPKLQEILKEPKFTRLVIEHKDRLTRFGFNYIESLLKNNDIEIEVVNNSESEKNDLIEDFVSVITSFCARIYGNRRSKRKTEKLIKELEISEKENDK
jgi:predicted site-specific integrase-resolvase